MACAVLRKSSGQHKDKGRLDLLFPLLLSGIFLMQFSAHRREQKAFQLNKKFQKEGSHLVCLNSVLHHHPCLHRVESAFLTWAGCMMWSSFFRELYYHFESPDPPVLPVLRKPGGEPLESTVPFFCLRPLGSVITLVTVVTLCAEQLSATEV